MRIPAGRCRLGMTEQTSEHRKTHSHASADAGESVPKVVYPHVLQPSHPPDLAPRLLKVDQSATGDRAGNDVLVAIGFFLEAS